MREERNYVAEETVSNVNIKEEKNMVNVIISMIINFFAGVACNLRAMFTEDRKEETGASELITVIALIVIVLAVAIIFKNQLSNIIIQLSTKVSNWIASN